jgi:hypothetical protein
MFYDVVDGIKFIQLELKDTKDTAKFASYLDLHLDTESEVPLRGTFYDTINNFHCKLTIYIFVYLATFQ